MKNSIKRGKVVQIFAAASANLLSILFGFVLSWTSPAIALLQSDATPLTSGPISTDEVSLMTALMYVGAVLGSLVAGWLANAVGRKRSLLILIMPQLCGFILIATAENAIFLHISRVFSGFSAGACVVVFPIFVSEISDKTLRGVVGNFLGFGFNMGCLMGKCLTSYGGFYATPIAVFIIISIFVVIFIQLPDTPQYLLLRNRLNDAENSLKFYRGVSQKDDMPEIFAEEFAELRNSPSLQNQKASLTPKDFKGGPTLLAIAITFFLSGNQNFTGNRILISYTESILRDSGSSMDTAAMDVLVTVIQVIAAIACIPIVKFLGFRKPLIWFYAISGIFLIMAGIHYNLHENGVDMNNFSWLIFTSIAISVAIPGTGMNSISFALPAEILPTKIRGSIISFTLILSWIVAFLSIQFYFTLAKFWGHSVWMWIFAIWCLFGVIFTYFFIPETKGKTFDDVVELLSEKIPIKWHKTITVTKSHDNKRY